MLDKDLMRMNELFDIEPEKRTRFQREELELLYENWELDQARIAHESWVASQPV